MAVAAAVAVVLNKIRRVIYDDKRMNCDDSEAGGPIQFLLPGSGEDCPARGHLYIQITLVARRIPLGEPPYIKSTRH